MMEPLTIHAIKDMLSNIAQSAEHCKISRQQEKTERARLEAQKKVLLDFIQASHTEKMSVIQATSQERMDTIRLIGEVLRKEQLTEIDRDICMGLMEFLTASQQNTVQTLEKSQTLPLLSEGPVRQTPQMPAPPETPRLPE